MAWIEKRTNWRLRDRIDGKDQTIIRNLGTWKAHAALWLLEYKKAKGLGFCPAGLPIQPSDITEFIKAKAEGRDPAQHLRRIPIEAFADFYLMKHGPSLKGGVQNSSRSNYYGRKKWVEGVKRFWNGKYADEITKLDVRDYLAQWANVGTIMRNLGTMTNMFRVMAEYNEEGIINPPIKLPPYNPGTKWRKEMKSSDKREVADDRVLSRDEWLQFSQHLKPRTFAICDIALRRFFRVSEIREFAKAKTSQGWIRGRQAKTGEQYSVPHMEGQLAKYDFTNFRREFKAAQIRAGMDHPSGHPMHFSIKDLRRTGATWAYRETKDLVSISAMLGHKKIQTTIRYLKIDDTDKIRIAKVVDRIAGRVYGKQGTLVDSQERYA